MCSVERQSSTASGFPLILHCKNFQSLHLIVAQEQDCHDVLLSLQRLSQPGKVGLGQNPSWPVYSLSDDQECIHSSADVFLLHRFVLWIAERYEELYCFSYNSKTDEQERRQEWDLLDVTADYNRMGLPNSLWKLSPINQQYKVGRAAWCYGNMGFSEGDPEAFGYSVSTGEQHVPSRPVCSQVRHPSSHRWQFQVQKQRPISCSVLLLQGNSSMVVALPISLLPLDCIKPFADSVYVVIPSSFFSWFACEYSVDQTWHHIFKSSVLADKPPCMWTVPNTRSNL